MQHPRHARFDLVIFDLAGTTVADNDDVTRCIRDTLRELAGLDLPLVEANLALGAAKDQSMAELLTRHGRPHSASDPFVQNLLHDFEQRMIRFYLEDPVVRELSDASAVFRTLRGSGVKIGVDTGFSRRVTGAILQRMGWERAGLLDAWTSCDQVAVGRPAPYMIYQLMERLGVTDVARVVKVGDTPRDLRMGANARVGLNVGVLNGSHKRHELEACPHDLLLPDISHLPAVMS